MPSAMISFHRLTTQGVTVTITSPILQTEKLRDREECDLPKVTQPVSDTAGTETLGRPTPESELPTVTVCPSLGHTSSDKEPSHTLLEERELARQLSPCDPKLGTPVGIKHPPTEDC